LTTLMQFRRSLSQLLGPSLVALVCIAIVGALQVPQLRKISAKSGNASIEALSQELEAEKLRLGILQKLPTFGFDNLVANWALLDFLEYFGDDLARSKTGYALSPEYFEVILRRDPRFLDAYLFLSSSTSIYAGLPQRSVDLMAEGLKQLSPHDPPRAYYVWRYKGIDELLFLGDSQAAKRSFEMAADWASTYSDVEGQQIAQVSRRTAQFLARNPKSKSAQVAAWSMVLSNAPDDRTRKIAIERIRGLGGDVFITPEGQVRILPPKAD
jgi:type II secretory pathway pseudopilin PulG